MNDGLIKARRNLIVVSVLLIVFDLAGVSVSNVTALGAELQIGRPFVIHILLWVAWGYFLLRYTQILGDEKNLGIRDAFITKIDSLTFDVIANIVAKCEPSSSSSPAKIGFSHLERNGLTLSLRVSEYDPGQGKNIELSVVPIPNRLLIPAIVRSAFHVAFITPKGTEYILPLLLAIAAPIAKLFM